MAQRFSPKTAKFYIPVTIAIFLRKREGWEGRLKKSRLSQRANREKREMGKEGQQEKIKKTAEPEPDG